MPETPIDPLKTTSDLAGVEPEIHYSSRAGLTNSVLGTRNLMVVAALAVVGSLIVVPLTYLGAAGVATPKGALAACAIMGLWIIPYLLPAVIVRRPGASLIAGIIMGIIAAFTTPMGLAGILGNVIGSLLIEIPLAMMLYRKWTWWAFGVSGLVFGCFNGYLYSTMLPLEPSMVAAVIGVSGASSLLGVALTLLLGQLANRAGVGITRTR